MLAEGGAHRLAVTSDVGVRVRVDGKVAFEDWTWHAPKRGEARIELAQGEHRIEIEYFQIDGATALAIELERVP
jgi:PA14 domain-containing protein